jgi:hypothetical protein
MAFLTTNPSPFIINVPELQNVQNSATGASGFSALSNTLNDILTYINTANSQININTIGSATTGAINFTSNINLSNSVITFLGSNLLGSNLLNGPGNYIAFQVNSIEQARLTATGFGIGTTSPALKLDVNGSAQIRSNLGIATSTPAYPLDVNGSAFIRGGLYVSTFGYGSTINIIVAENNTLSITSNGVGIGTATPSTSLDVIGNAYISENLIASTFGGTQSVKLFVNNIEHARLTSTGLGIQTSNPRYSLDVTGNVYINNSLGIGISSFLLPCDISGGAIVRGPLYVSTFGAVSSQTGNIIASGDVFANGFFYPSDPLLKRDIISYISPGLPTPVEFNWHSNGKRDIGFLADEVARFEPACVMRGPAGTLTVDYAKLSVLLCAEVQSLKYQISTLAARLPQ